MQLSRLSREDDGPANNPRVSFAEQLYIGNAASCAWPGDMIGFMRPTLEDGLRALRDASERAKSIRIDLDDDYLANIARVEASPPLSASSG